MKSSYKQSPVITLESDAASAEAIPAAVRSAVDSMLFGSLKAFRTTRVPRGTDGVVTWLDGEQLLEGDVASIRQNLRTPGRRVFVPVHLPCFQEVDLITIQPRWFSAGRQHDYWDFSIRIGSSATVSQQAITALKANAEPWSQLSLALLAGQEKPGAEIDALVRMWQEHQQLPSALAALVLRNFAVVMMRHQDLAKAEELLELGMKAYPGYAELPYLRGLLCFHQEQSWKAWPPLLEKLKAPDRGFLGSGGESSYRANWLLGILDVSTGSIKAAFERFLPGMLRRPVFAPAAEELLKLRLPPTLVEKHRWDFCSLARDAPEFLEAVFDFLLLHRAFPSARHLVENLPLAEDTAALLRDRLESATAPFRRTGSLDTGKPGIILSGPFLEQSSLGRINREIGASLVRSPQLDACLEPSSVPSLVPQKVTNGDVLRPAFFRHPEHLDLTIRHQWPPDFSRPPRGKLAVTLPWEYGAVPSVWVDQIRRNVDELWVPSRFVRDVFVRCGVESDRVQVIPNGVDPKVFTPEGPVLRPHGCRKFMFLFVGGAIRRKGVDALLQAYKACFDPGEHVTLVIHILGSAGAYQHNTLTAQMQEVANDPKAPHLQFLVDSFDDATLASVYRGCDAFVLPYRGEGFGMPLVEAMACGKPVITTARGPSEDFCSKKTAYLVSAREEEVPDDPPPLGQFAGDFTWFEPDLGELALTLRYVYEHRDEAIQRGRAASKTIRERYAWSRVTQIYLDRIRQLVAPSEYIAPRAAVQALEMRA
ncbi:MAG TPA: glycosyltransferase [Terriglobia bacterium]|nr:glycosyltransferase [Terriglobia bacterium]